MKKSSKKTTSINKWLDEKYGKKGTPVREEFREEAYNYYYGEILKNRRKELKMTQDELAQKIGKKRPYISRIENGEDIKLSNLVSITNALGLSIQFTPSV